MLTAFEAHLIAFKATEEFYDRADVKAVFAVVEKDVKTAAGKAQTVLRYGKEDSQALLGGFDRNEVNLLQVRIKDFGYECICHQTDREVSFLTIKWEGEDEEDKPE